jgi:hypothetical protein
MPSSTEALNARAVIPGFAHNSTVSSAAAWCEFQEKATSAPCAANATHNARPNPRDPPVTNAFFPSSSLRLKSFIREALYPSKVLQSAEISGHATLNLCELATW